MLHIYFFRLSIEGVGDRPSKLKVNVAFTAELACLKMVN